MTINEKLSSPSSASNYSQQKDGNSVGNSSRGTIQSNSDEPCLVIKTHPPSCVYSNESFRVEVQLELPKTSSPPSTIWNIDEAIHLKATLYTKSGKVVRDEAILMTTPMRITIPGAANADNSSNSTSEGTNENDNNSNGKRSVTVECIIRTDSIRQDSETGYVVRFSTSSEERRRNNNPMNSPGRARVVRGVSTRPTQLVNYKIRATVEEDWGSVWYKDEGGRDKSMEVFVAIYDKDGQLKTGENIPLCPVLCYKVDKDASETMVANQDILRTLGSANILLDKDTGRTRLRFRVEDVSKNHQGQDFILKITPDTRSKRYKDIAPAYTPAVNVRSKRNKRSRGGSTRVSGKPGNDIPGRSSDSPSATRQRITGSFGAGGQETLRSSSGAQNVPLNPADANRLQQAMRGIIGWADEVVNGLYPLQWQVLGYQQHPDGTPDYTRPYHDMPNPNGPISRILSAYTDQVRGHLRVLLSAIEEAQATSITPGGGGVSTATDYMPSALQGRGFQSNDPYASLLGQNRFGVQAAAAAGTMGSDLGMRVPGDAGLSQAVIGGTSGLHPSVASDGLRVRAESGNVLPYPSRSNVNNPTALTGIPGTSSYGLHGQNTMSAVTMPQQSGLRGNNLDSQHRSLGNDESEVEHVLAKQYKTLRNGTRLGFPAFSASKEILGFFREGNGKVGVGQFVPISHHCDDFGPLEILQASEILEDFIAKKSDAVFSLKDHANITSLLDSALVYDWSKDINNGTNAQVNQT